MSLWRSRKCRYHLHSHFKVIRPLPLTNQARRSQLLIPACFHNSISSSVATYDVTKTDTNSTLELVQSETYHLPQAAIRPVGELHQSLPDFAIADPSGKFLLVPDPGADFVRIYLLNEGGRLRFTDLPPLIISGGPRYADFLVTLDGTVYLYVTTANTNMIMGYKVLYTSSTTIEFKNVQESRISTNGHDVGGDVHISVNAKPSHWIVVCGPQLMTALLISLIANFSLSRPAAMAASQYPVPLQPQKSCQTQSSLTVSIT